MGDLQKRLNEFQKQSKTAYSEIMNILEDKYCWKCPMRSTSSQSRCREIHSGRVLQEALEEGIITQLNEAEFSTVEVEALITRVLKKKIKRQGGKQRGKTIVIEVEADQCPDLAPGSWLKVKVNSKRVRVGDEILIADKELEYPLLGVYALVAGFPFQITPVKRTFHVGNFWYVEVENDRILPLESIFGVLVNVFKDDNSISIE